jgi:hypothetical protein
MDDEKPSTKHLVLAPKEIVPIDKLSRPGDGTVLSVQLIHLQNRLAEEKAAQRKRDGTPFPVPEPEPALPPVFKPKEIAPIDPPSHPGDGEAIRVPELLLQNRIAEERSTWGRIKNWRRRKSRRLRDFLLSVGTLDLATIILMRMESNPFTFVYGIAFITLVTSMSAWMMFVVMDDY